MSSGNHSFSPLVATIIGVKKAVVLQHFEFLQQSFVTEKVSIKKVWVRRSVKALTATYPYMTPKEIRGCLDGLVRDEYLDTIVNNGSSTDHTKSYQLTEKGWNLIGQPKEISDLPAGAKGLPAGANRLHKRANPNIVSSNQFIIHSTTTESEIDAAAELLIKSTTEFENVTLVESLALKAEKENPSPVPPAPSPQPAPGESAPRRWDMFDIDRAAIEFKENHFSAENFARITGTPAAQMVAKFTAEVDVFVLEQKGKKTPYNRFDEFSSHFFNYERAKVRAERNTTTQKTAYGQHAQPNQPSPKNYMPSYS